MKTQLQSTSAFIRNQARYICGLLLLAVVVGFSAPRAEAQTRVVVRDSLGLSSLLNLCNVLGCSVDHAVGDPDGQLFVVVLPPPLDLSSLQALLNLNLGIVSVELDQIVKTQGADAGPAPYYLTDTTPVNYYGTTAWRGYVTQPANQLIRTSATQSTFNATGANIVVAVIDTGVDPNHPVLANSLVTGYDFTRNQSGGSEVADVSQSSVAVLDARRPARVSQSSVAVLDQSSVAVLDNPEYAAFGHGTMVSGIIHLVAPNAKIMPLKAFHADGSAYNSDVLSAIYYATSHGAKVVNMSFNYTSYSKELENAVNYAADHGLILVAAAGNDGLETKVYPGAFQNVIDVASTGNNDIQSTFTNYGAPPVWLAAPGEAIVTTYPYNTYAASWGTSFSAPFVSGTAAMMAGVYSAQASAQVTISLGLIKISVPLCLPVSTLSNQTQAANALANAQDISNSQLGKGRLDTYKAVSAYRTNLGLK
jgi:subtilisin family serine protease